MPASPEQPTPPPHPIRRVAMVSLHTSPLAQPGSGSAGGMNVMVAQTANRLARRGIDVDVYTAAATAPDPPAVEVHRGVRVHTIDTGPLTDQSLSRITRFTEEVRRAAAGQRYDVVHSHYWMSGVAALSLTETWDVPLIHSAHTLARVKDAARSADDAPEPAERIQAEDRLVARANRLVAATGIEAGQLTRLYGADEERICIIPPGVDTDVFRPPRDAQDRQAIRIGLGLEAADRVLVFAGRIQPHKGPRVLVETMGVLHSRFPEVRWRALIIGGHSGADHDEPGRLRSLAAELGVQDRVQLLPAVPAAELAEIFRAADVVVMPSHSESFGLVALEAQAAGTPVLAAAVGGLSVAVADGISGRLVTGRAPADWADAVASVVLDPGRREAMGLAARSQAARFSWDATADGLVRCYQAAISRSRPPGSRPAVPGTHA